MKKRTQKYYAQCELTIYIIYLWVFHTMIHILTLDFLVRAPFSSSLACKKDFIFGFTTIDLILIISCVFLFFSIAQIRIVIKYKTKHILSLFVILIFCSIFNVVYCLNFRRIGNYSKGVAKEWYQETLLGLKKKNFRYKGEREDLLESKRRLEAILKE